MCGICGFVDFENSIHIDSIRKMMSRMKHRGPDDEGVFLDETIGLGFVRLSIIDLSKAGHQPMFSQDGRYIIIFNGEIYNYIELREELRNQFEFRTNTDTEVLLAAFIKWKEKCLERLNGMFAFVIYDRVNGNIFGARDRFGIKPFYYTLNENKFVFASEIPPILEILKVKPNPENQSIFDYLVFNRTDHSSNTFFEGIFKLPHGHYFLLNLNTDKPGNIVFKRWYNLEEKLGKPFQNEHEYKELLTSSVKLRLRSDVPVGVCLSGGLDSSSIVSIISKSLNQPEISTFSAVYKKGSYGDESEFINEYKPYLKNMYFTFPDASTLFKDKENFISAHGEPVPSTGPYAHYKVMELAKEHVVVTLDGQGADEELAGYHYFFGFYFKELLYQLKLARLVSETIHYLHNHKSTYGLKAWLYSMLPSGAKSSLRVSEKGYLNQEFIYAYKENNKVVDSLYNARTLNKALLNHFEYKLEHLLKWEDRNSMWFSLESRVPFLDYRLVEKTLSLPSDMIVKKGMTKYILRESMKGLVPEKIVKRKDKLGFATPQDEWFREREFKEFIYLILNSNEFASLKIINPVIALRLYNDHIEKKINISNEIWKWTNLYLWFQKFIEK